MIKGRVAREDECGHITATPASKIIYFCTGESYQGIRPERDLDRKIHTAAMASTGYLLG